MIQSSVGGIFVSVVPSFLSALSHHHVDFYSQAIAFNQMVVEDWKQQENTNDKPSFKVSKKFLHAVHPLDVEQCGKIQPQTALHPQTGSAIDPVYFSKVLILQNLDEVESPPIKEDPNFHPECNKQLENLANRILKDAKTGALCLTDELGNNRRRKRLWKRWN